MMIHRTSSSSLSPVFLQFPTKRYSSHAPMNPAAPTRKKVTMTSLRKLYDSGIPISMVTAHDFPSGLVADHAGVDMVLVGDSLAMVGLGMEDTNEIRLDDMLHHSRAVARAVKGAFTVCDMPMGSYEVSPDQAVQSAIRIIQEGRAQAVKIEGGAEMAPTIKRITSAGISVLGHIGLTPQRQHSLGGFRVQGKTASSAAKILDDALAVQEAGCFAMVVEAVPPAVADLVTKSLDVPTIGIGAGSGCSGQVLVQIDMLGNFPEGRFMPKFVKTYENIFEKSKNAIEEYIDEVKSRSYPAAEHTYPMNKSELEEFERIVVKRLQRELENQKGDPEEGV
ncbi:3-methyl-2-oxobutanoate hydroxymethyltransferase-like protein [Peziza echinospora]|nr:3-methyl-2-oxobutanoate hydroxymethyltransferase-like protein [Peziza echinospora]